MGNSNAKAEPPPPPPPPPSPPPSSHPVKKSPAEPSVPPMRCARVCKTHTCRRQMPVTSSARRRSFPADLGNATSCCTACTHRTHTLSDRHRGGGAMRFCLFRCGFSPFVSRFACSLPPCRRCFFTKGHGWLQVWNKAPKCGTRETWKPRRNPPRRVGCPLGSPQPLSHGL